MVKVRFWIISEYFDQRKSDNSYTWRKITVLIFFSKTTILVKEWFLCKSFQKCPKDVDLITLSVEYIFPNRTTLLNKKYYISGLIRIVMLKDKCLLCSWKVKVFGLQLGLWLICWLMILNLECKISEKMHANCKFDTWFRIF